MIDYTLLQQLINTSPTIPVGESLRFDHAGCPAGEDTRARLYVKRTSDNFWVAYCHNCGSPGWYKQHPHFTAAFNSSDVLVDQLKRLLEKDELPPITEHDEGTSELSLPLGELVSVAHCDEWMVQRFRAAGFTNSQIDLLIMWYMDKDRNTLVTPLWYAGKVVGKQERMPPGFKPKTLTSYVTNAPKVGYDAMQDRSLSIPTRALVITEDPLSALCAHHACFDASGYALLGTHLSDVKRNHILELVNQRSITRLLVWLDPDEAGRKGTWDVVNALKGVLPEKVGLFVAPSDQPEPAKVGNLASVSTLMFEMTNVKGI